MSDRSNLEKASWVAGILSAAIALFLLIKPDGFKSIEKNETEASEKVAEAPLAPLTLIASKATPTPAENTASKACTAETRSLTATLEAAQKIYSTKMRDGMYLDISRRALCIGDQEVYEHVVKMIYTTTIRDQAYTEGVDHYLRARNSDMALSFAQKIYQTTVRDEALARIASPTIQ